MRLIIGNQHYNIEDNNIEIIDLTSLSQLTNLKYLNLNDNRIIDITHLSNLTDTTVLISALPITYHQNPTHPLILSTLLSKFDKDLTNQLF